MYKSVKQKMKEIVLVVLLVLVAANVFAHGGRTDRNGYHIDRKTGIRH